MISGPLKLKQGYSIVFLVLIYSIGTMGIFSTYYTQYHRDSFQLRVKETRAEELVKLVFSPQEFESIDWKEQGTEFEWQGKMYDVSKISKTDKGYIILCEHDSLEELLLTFLNVSKAHKEGSGNKKGNPQPQFLYTKEVSELFVGHPDPRKYFSMHASLYCSICLGTSSPPPKS